ncbi:MAG: ABC transporter permease [Turicibacter sp.]|nr:ABC transporter permease [Turicibacter sp.]
MTKNKAVEHAISEREVKKRSQWGMVFQRLKRNKMAMAGLVILILLILMAAFAPVITPFSYYYQQLGSRLQGPCSTHWFGTDHLGRDIFTRIVYGARVSLQVGLISIGIATLIGGLLGAIAGYYGGHFDTGVMRFMDILLAVPGILLAISIVAALGPGITNVMIAVGIGATPVEARVIRASVMQVRDQEFVEAAKAVGTSDLRIIFKHILPNAMAQIIVQATLGVAGAILAAAGLSFIGLGIQPPSPEWGAMLSEGRQHLRDHWHVTTFPGIAIMTTIFALNLLGDGLRDALDPKLKN